MGPWVLLLALVAVDRLLLGAEPGKAQLERLAALGQSLRQAIAQFARHARVRWCESCVIRPPLVP